MELSINLNEVAMRNTENKISITNGFEYIILCLVAGIGLMGSIYLFAANSQNDSNNNFNQFATATILSSDDEVRNSFSDYVKITGKKRVDIDLSFKTKMDIKAKRYVMEMGDGMRMIITQPSFEYKYAKKGKYELELKTIERGLITTLATKTIKIK
jgi:hypothetical protein